MTSSINGRLEDWKKADKAAAGTRLAEEPSFYERAAMALRVVLYIFVEYLKMAPEICAAFYRLIVKPERKNIAGKVVLVTGAGNGLGRLLALYLSKEGAKVICVDIDPTAAEAVAREINGRRGEDHAKAYKADVSSVEDVENLKNNVKKHFGGIDILVNNAGVIPLIGLFEGSENDIKRTIDVNLMSQFWMARAFVPEMQSRGGGHVMSISSMAALYHGCYPGMTAYIASKCGVSSLTACISAEAPLVKTTTVFPMTIATRKYIVDHLKCILPPLTPEQVANVAVDALLREYDVVSIPANLYPMISFFGMFPKCVRKPVENIINPNVF